MKRKSPLRAAYLKGLHAGLLGESADACPYRDIRKSNGRLTWSHAFIREWHAGREHAVKNRADALITASYTRGLK
jgi:ribosome modulation factor